MVWMGRSRLQTLRPGQVHSVRPQEGKKESKHCVVSYQSLSLTQLQHHHSHTGSAGSLTAALTLQLPQPLPPLPPHPLALLPPVHSSHLPRLGTVPAPVLPPS